MTEQTEDRLRRIDITWRGQTERYFAARSDDDPKWWIIYSPEDWIDCEIGVWTLFEGPKEFDGDDGERIYFQGQPPMPGANWKWIDPAPTPDAYKELRKVYKQNNGE